METQMKDKGPKKESKGRKKQKPAKYKAAA